MKDLKCTSCGKTVVGKQKRYANIFCNSDCYHLWQKTHKNKGCFQEGQEPWNKNLKGIHLSPATEFKKGQDPPRHEAIGTVTIRTRKRDGQQRAWIKVAEPNTWKSRATFVWEKHYGPLPKGLVIHHLDRDTLNDKVTNLIAVSRAAHMNEHRYEIRKGCSHKTHPA
jgi:hypothetical protein